MAAAGCPLAAAATIRKTPGLMRTLDPKNRPMDSRPANQVGVGGISSTAFSVSSPIRAVTSAFSKSAT